MQAQSGSRPTVEEIVGRMLVKNGERQAALEHYRTDRTYHLEYDGTGGKHHAEMVVRAGYGAPARSTLPWPFALGRCTDNFDVDLEEGIVEVVDGGVP